MDASGTPASSADPYSGFGGQWGYYLDAETGLELLTHRYYDSGTGRFVTRDPIRYNGGVNIYSYTANNPINENDPSGLSPDAISAHNYWMSAAENGESRGGVVGNAQAVGASLMAATIDFFGARNIQQTAAEAGDAEGNGDTTVANFYKVGTGLQILFSAFAGWTGGGGSAAVGVGLRDVGWYEIGSQTINSKIFKELADQGLIEDKVALGKLLVKKYGLKEALLHNKVLRPGLKDWGFTVPEGPTPGAYLGVMSSYAIFKQIAAAINFGDTTCDH